jgi:predicted  nucleic acid-binding Zn-ribbon protein
MTAAQSALTEARVQMNAISLELDNEKQLTATLKSDIASLSEQKNRLAEQNSELQKSVDAATARYNDLHR